MFVSLFLLSGPSQICKNKLILDKILDLFESAFSIGDIQVRSFHRRNAVSCAISVLCL